MSTLYEHASQWHPGEEEIHRLLNGTVRESNPTARGLPGPYAHRVAASPLVAVGALDAQGRPWTTVWGGEKEFAHLIAPSVLGLQSLVDIAHDPVVDALFGGRKDGELVRPQQEGRGATPMAALSIDLATRDRVKLAGKMVVGAVARHDADGVGEAQLAMLVEESLGNCPKYLNKKAIRPHVPKPHLISDSLPLPTAAIDLIHRADLFFLSSTDGHTMDTNHRGGAPGLVRVMANSDDGGTVLVYPEFSGNRLYQTLGNLQVRPRVGIAVPDFATGDVLYITGETTTLIGSEAAAVLPHTRLAIRIAVTAARFVRDGLPFRGDVIDYSPYNPPVRRLASEQSAPGAKESATATATLVDRTLITPTIARLTFKLRHTGEKETLRAWRPGQYVTLDFAPELDVGWSHMRDADPQSLNDDYVRTFTVSSAPPVVADGIVPDGAEFAITARRHGPATGLLWRHPLRGAGTLELPVLGFGGEDGFRIPLEGVGDEGEAVFVAARVGITPLLAQAPGLLAAKRRLQVLWSLRAEDLPLAADVFSTVEGLAPHVRLFITGTLGDAAQIVLERVREMGAETVVGHRLVREDVVGGSDTKKGERVFYLCTGAELQKSLMEWLKGESVVWESFAY